MFTIIHKRAGRLHSERLDAAVGLEGLEEDGSEHGGVPPGLDVGGAGDRHESVADEGDGGPGLEPEPLDGAGDDGVVAVSVCAAEVFDVCLRVHGLSVPRSAATLHGESSWAIVSSGTPQQLAEPTVLLRDEGYDVETPVEGTGRWHGALRGARIVLVRRRFHDPLVDGGGRLPRLDAAGLCLGEHRDRLLRDALQLQVAGVSRDDGLRHDLSQLSYGEVHGIATLFQRRRDLARPRAIKAELRADVSANSLAWRATSTR